MVRKNFSVTVAAALVTALPSAYASQANSSSGSVTYVRAYEDSSGGVRLELGVSPSASHNCCTVPTVYYFDTSKIGADTTKSLIAIATAAMIAGTSVTITYDCAIAGGGYGWGVALSASI